MLGSHGPLGAAFFSEKTMVDVDVLMIFEGLATFVDSHLRFSTNFDNLNLKDLCFADGHSAINMVL